MDYDDQDATAEQTAAFEAAVQAAVERALALRLPALLDDGLHHALAPLSGEVATAFADIEFSVQRLAVVEERARVAEARAVAAEQRARAAEDALDAARTRGIVLEAQVAALSAPSGLFRRRRRIPDALLA